MRPMSNQMRMKFGYPLFIGLVSVLLVVKRISNFWTFSLISQVTASHRLQQAMRLKRGLAASPLGVIGRRRRIQSSQLSPSEGWVLLLTGTLVTSGIPAFAGMTPS